MHKIKFLLFFFIVVLFNQTTASGSRLQPSEKLFPVKEYYHYDNGRVAQVTAKEKIGIFHVTGLDVIAS